MFGIPKAGPKYAIPLNHQAGGPLILGAIGEIFYDVTEGSESRAVILAKIDLAFPPRNHDPVWHKSRQTGLLLTEAYNCFDTAGRELGVDAVELAKKLDLAKLLRFMNRRDFTPEQRAILASALEPRKLLE